MLAPLYTSGMRCLPGVAPPDTTRGPPLPKPNYAFAKRQRDLAKQQKKEEKKQKKAAGKTVPGDAPADPPVAENDKTGS